MQWHGITSLQKVIEILASYPKITFEKLLEEIDEPKKRVKEILRSYSSTSKPPEESISFDMLNRTYTNFVIRNIIITEHEDNDAKPTF